MTQQYPVSQDGPQEDAVRILGIVDLHWSGKNEPRLPSTVGYDLVLVAGDLTNFRGPEEAAQLLDGLGSGGVPVYAVCGNCDQPSIESYLEERGCGLDRRCVIDQGVRLLGLSGGLPFGDLPYERTESEYTAACEELWQQARRVGEAHRPTLLVTHQPAFDTPCDLARGNPVGSRSIRASIEEHQPDLAFSGHIHESVGTGRLGDTVLVNPGPWFEGRWVDITVHPARQRGQRVEVTIHQS